VPSRYQKTFVHGISVFLYAAASGAADLLASALSELGVRVAAVTDDVAEAVALMERRTFDVAIVSTACGGEHAIRVVRQARRYRARVVCLTSGAIAEPPEAWEADAVLAADVDPTLLLACIMELAGYAWGS